MTSHAHADCQPGKSRGIDTVEHLVEHLAEVVTPRCAIVCVGNDLCGDDGAGVAIARRIQEAVPWDVFDVRTVPESFLMKIVGCEPDTVLLIDALHFDAAPGAVELFDAEQITGQGPSTHGPAPLAFLDVLEMMRPCRRAILGIQARRVEFGDEMSPPVGRAVDLVVEALLKLAESPA